MQKITKRVVESAELRKKPYFIFDDIINGFCIRITPHGRRNYYFQYFKGKTPVRLFIGQHGAITTEKARDTAISMLASFKEGGEPRTSKASKKLEPYMGDLAKRFTSEHIMTRCKPKTRSEYSFHLERDIIPFFANKRVSEVTRADVSNLQHSISIERTQDAANRVIKILSKMFNLAEVWGLRAEGTNPCRHVKKFKMQHRERYLNKEEAKKLGQIVDEVKQYPDENLAAAYCIQLLMLTGCRLGEIQTLKWEYIDYDNELIKLPDSKTGAKIVYVGDIVINVLEEIKNNPRRPTDNPYVVWGRKPDTYLNNVHKPWRRFRKLAGLDDLRIHDLRHSFASFAVNSGMSLPMIGKLLGHSQTQTTARYAHLRPHTMKEAANSITNELCTIFQINHVGKNKNVKSNQITTEVIPGTNIEAPVYFTSEQAAKYLNVNPRLMDDWRWRKAGPAFVKVGGRIRYTLTALKEFLSS